MKMNLKYSSQTNIQMTVIIMFSAKHLHMLLRYKSTSMKPVINSGPPHLLLEVAVDPYHVKKKIIRVYFHFYLSEVSLVLLAKDRATARTEDPQVMVLLFMGVLLY